eukprot:1550881-Pleurochrysis_carterae.AAC.1
MLRLGNLELGRVAGNGNCAHYAYMAGCEVLACLIAFFITSQLTPERRSTCSTLTTGSRGSFVLLRCDVLLRVTSASSRVDSSSHPEARQLGTGSLLSARNCRPAPPSAPAIVAM